MFIQVSSRKQTNIRLEYKNTSINQHKKTQVKSYFSNRQLRVLWLKNGKYHRANDAPAIVSYFENGQIEAKLWYINGKSHRNDAPAIIYYFKNGIVKEKIYYENDVLYKRYN